MTFVDRQLADGIVRGAERDGVQLFLGLPYAAPPVGELRFRAPQAVTPWTGVREALELPPMALQPALAGKGLVGGEDCLYLNVYAPAAPGPYPVLVWIHGGGGVMGSPNQFDGSAFAGNGVVVVTIAYRLGVLGMLYRPDVADVNVSTLDQVKALEWVRDNVSAFGGDPARVTLGGQSNGGRTVGTLLAVPAADGLFRQAIIQSGTGVGSVVDTPDEATKVADAVQAEAGGDLRELPAGEIVAAQQRVGLASGTMVTYRVVVDGTVLPRRPGEVKSRVPVLIGTTHDEQDLFHMLTRGGARLLGSGSTVLNPEELAKAAAAYRELLPEWPAELAERHAFTAGDWWIPAIRFAESQDRPVWMYRLDWRITPFGKGMGAPHGLDLALMFDDIRNVNWRYLFGARKPDWERLQAVATEMHSAWVRFVASGNPGWPAYTPESRTTRLFDDVTSTVDDPDREQRLAWALGS
ncbi:carboxylesterase/lipase family protein [Amycolatopsis sp. NPDC059657]|uniref:carboxylesterase/lipase family protein n=1 Tax=Amycolatopsis sp. NPDC059657 TaxID=3346899 RepID=UPI00366B82D8